MSGTGYGRRVVLAHLETDCGRHIRAVGDTDGEILVEAADGVAAMGEPMWQRTFPEDDAAPVYAAFGKLAADYYALKQAGKRGKK